MESVSKNLLLFTKTRIFFRKDLRRLNHSYQKDIDHILNSLKTWKCGSCESDQELPKSEPAASSSIVGEEPIPLRPIGIVTTSFHEKRAIPRQSVMCPTSQGKLTIFNSVFTNPDHALEGLEEFSHMWYDYRNRIFRKSKSLLFDSLSIFF